MRVKFCSLDARDDAYTEYSTAAFVDPVKDEHAVYGKSLEKLAIRMEREYLTRLAALQDELAAKYEALANNLGEDEPPDEEPYGKALGTVEYDLAAAAAKLEFPGRTARYYT